MSTEKTYVEFTWEEWMGANDPQFEAEYERQEASSAVRPGKKSGKSSRIRIKNGYADRGTTSNDAPLQEDYSIKE